VTENYAETYPAALAGWFNIGVLHTSCTGRPPHAPYAPCTVQDLAARGYQYWALGHVHDHEILGRDPFIVYPGNIQGRSIRETGPKGIVLVDVEDGAVTDLRRVILDKARWTLLRLDISGVGDEDAMLRLASDALEAAMREAEGRLLVVRVELAGATPLHRRLAAERGFLRDELQAAAHRLHEDIFIEEVVVRTGDPERRQVSAADTGLLDPAALMTGLEQDVQLRAEAAELLRSIAAKLPASAVEGASPLGEELEALLEEAAALVLGRLEGRSAKA
jgi:DNA repair protein SbcD/Mre11